MLPAFTKCLVRLNKALVLVPRARANLSSALKSERCPFLLAATLPDGVLVPVRRFCGCLSDPFFVDGLDHRAAAWVGIIEQSLKEIVIPVSVED
jgi:hypothetical protein